MTHAAPDSPGPGFHGPEFLDWDGPLLERAASRLVEGLDGPTDLGDVLVALPGARAGRLFLAHLGDAMRARGWSGFFPPRILTQGRLVDELLFLRRPTADRMTRTFAWERALAGASAETLSRLVAHRPDRADRAAWLRIAEDLRSLHAELATWGLDFADVRERLDSEGMAPASELRRWSALAAVQADWRSRMDALGLDDPHEGRSHALEAGRVMTDARVILIGVVDMNSLLRRALEQLDEPPRILTFAPADRAEGFDAFGCLVTERWLAADIDIPLDAWHVVGSPDEQARMALALVAGGADGKDGVEHAADVSFGVPDEDVVPNLVRRLAAAGARARDAAGTPFDRSAPARLLDAFRGFVDTSASHDLAVLLRHPDLGRVLASRLDHDPVARFDAYRPEHLPRRLDPLQPDVPESARKHRDIKPLLDEIAWFGGPLVSSAARPLKAVVSDVRAFLTSVYEGHPLLEEDLDADSREDGRHLATSLELVGAAVSALESVPAAVAGEVSPAAAIGLVLRTANSIGAIPSAPAREGESVVELLGWLELLLDDAPHLVITGFNEGRVPESKDGDAFLPDRVRTMLGLEDEERRLGRDVYTTCALMASREHVHFVSGRTSRVGDALFPSRLAFFAPDAEVPARIQHALESLEFPPVERTGRPMENDLPPIDPSLASASPPETFAVTSFQVFIDSPMLYHLRRVRHLEPVDDRAGEMDPRGFGTLVHEVLEAFGRKGPKESTDAGEIYANLEKHLARIRAKRFPDNVLPAVPLQLEQLKYRLRSFSEWQAQRAADGWRIRHVEWKPDGDGTHEHRECAKLDMGDGEPPAWIRGSIDRIEQNVDTGLWCVLDYKTSKEGKSPEKTHRKTTKDEVTWRDLQLPLYAFMTEPLVGKGVVPGLGYVNLPDDASKVGIQLVGTEGSGWDRAVVDDALERAREIVRAVRAGDVTDTRKLTFLSPIEEELFGVGLVRAPEVMPDESETGGAA